MAITLVTIDTERRSTERKNVMNMTVVAAWAGSWIKEEDSGSNWNPE